MNRARIDSKDTTIVITTLFYSLILFDTVLVSSYLSHESIHREVFLSAIYVQGHAESVYQVHSVFSSDRFFSSMATRIVLSTPPSNLRHFVEAIPLPAWSIG